MRKMRISEKPEKALSCYSRQAIYFRKTLFCAENLYLLAAKAAHAALALRAVLAGSVSFGYASLTY